MFSKKILFSFLFLSLFLSPYFAMAQEHSHHQSESPCSDDGMDVSYEVQLWKAILHPSILLAASSIHRLNDFQRITVGEKKEIIFHPEQRVIFAHPPEKVRTRENPFAGLVKMSVPEASTYRISINGRPWVDMVDESAQLTPTTNFAGLHSCPLFKKSLEFELLPNRDYIIQFSSSEANSAVVMLSQVQ